VRHSISPSDAARPHTYVFASSLLQAGASGFLLKTAPPRAPLATIRIIAAGEALLAPAITRRMIQDYVRRPTARSWRPSRPGHAHPTGTRGSHPDRARTLQRRDRRRAVPERTDHQHIRDPHPGQAAAPGPGPGRGSRLRKRTHPAGNSLTRRLRSRGPCAIIRPYPAGEYSDRTADPSPARLPPSSSNGPTEQTRSFCTDPQVPNNLIAGVRNRRSRRWSGWRDAWQIPMRRPGWPRDGSPLGRPAHLRWNGQLCSAREILMPDNASASQERAFEVSRDSVAVRLLFVPWCWLRSVTGGGCLSCRRCG
jgi:hypothetical protein